VGDLHNPNNAQASGIMTIPARCVMSIERLSEERRPSASAEIDSAGIGDQDFRSERTRQVFVSLVA
jgi:hypothetical protein